MRRVTLSLPAELVDRAKRIAVIRQVKLSVVIAEAVTAGWGAQVSAEGDGKALQDYKNGFSAFTEEEMGILDGIILESENQQK